MDVEIAEKLALRDRVMRREYLSLTPEERVERMRRLNEWSVARLAANPEGFRRFFARNLAQRAVRQSHGFKPQYEFIALLQQHRVEFCLIGGHAVQAHGFGRETEDIDIVWRRSDENDAHLVAVLKQANASWISSEKDPATGIERLVPVDDGYVRINHLMMLWTDYGFVDLFDYIPGYPREDVTDLFSSAILIQQVPYCSLEWLKKMKLAAGRPKDRTDLERLP